MDNASIIVGEILPVTVLKDNLIGYVPIIAPKKQKQELQDKLLSVNVNTLISVSNNDATLGIQAAMDCQQGVAVGVLRHRRIDVEHHRHVARLACLQGLLGKAEAVYGVDTTEESAGGDNVTDVAVATAGSGYVEAPGVTFSGGGGSSSGYLANAVIYSNSTGYLSNTNNFQFLGSNSSLILNGNFNVSNGLTTINYTSPVGSQLTALAITGANTKGGQGYLDFLLANNQTPGTTYQNKWFRLDSSGQLQIINSAYTTNIFNLTDAGALTVPGPVSFTNSTTSTSNSTGALQVTGGVGVGGNLYVGGIANFASNVFIGGNLIVTGNSTIINSSSLAIQDPVIDIGTAANAAPLTTNDGKDRGSHSLLGYKRHW